MNIKKEDSRARTAIEAAEKYIENPSDESSNAAYAAAASASYSVNAFNATADAYNNEEIYKKIISCGLSLLEDKNENIANK